VKTDRRGSNPKASGIKATETEIIDPVSSNPISSSRRNSRDHVPAKGGSEAADALSLKTSKTSPRAQLPHLPINNDRQDGLEHRGQSSGRKTPRDDNAHLPGIDQPQSRSISSSSSSRNNVDALPPLVSQNNQEVQSSNSSILSPRGSLPRVEAAHEFTRPPLIPENSLREVVEAKTQIAAHVTEIEEKLKKLEEVEQNIKEKEKRIAKMWQDAELQAQRAAEALAMFQQHQKQAEYERERMQRLLDLAAGTDIDDSRSHSAPQGKNRPSSNSRSHASDTGYDASVVHYQGDDWVRHWDPNEQAWYWYNTNTQVAQWEYPGESAGSSEGGYDSGAPDSNEEGYSSGYDSSVDHSNITGHSESPWEEYWDEQAQAKYWYNNVTGEATWTRPDEVHGSLSAESSIEDVGRSEDWIAVIDDATQQEYWYNSVTGETSWT
jgi:hypothetical protein